MFSYRIDDSLQLRLPEERHAEELAALVGQDYAYLKEWMPWLKDDYTVADAQEYIKRNLQQFADNNGFGMNLVYQNKIAGSIGYNRISWADRRTEIGYWLGSRYQGRGLMTKACRVLIDYAFTELNLNRVEIHCGTQNRKSRMIPERLGFTQEGVLRQAEWLHYHFVDLVVYSMLAREWLAKNPGR
jgi:ribosomal-protein-serine acetyltransferase